MSLRDVKTCPHDDFYVNVMAASFVVAQTGETTQISINQQDMEKQMVAQPCNGVVLSHGKE